MNGQGRLTRRGHRHFWLYISVSERQTGFVFPKYGYMNDSDPDSGVWFPHWADVLAKVRLKELERRAYQVAIVEYLGFCKRSRQPSSN